MKLTLDAQVQLNSKRIETIMSDVDTIKNNHLAHMAKDIDELKAEVKELNSNVIKILTLLAENKNA